MRSYSSRSSPCATLILSTLVGSTTSSTTIIGPLVITLSICMVANYCDSWPISFFGSVSSSQYFRLNASATTLALAVLVFVLAVFCWTKSLSCTVVDFTGMPYQFRVFKYSEFISLIWKGPYYDKISVTSVKKEFLDSKKTLQSL